MKGTSFSYRSFSLTLSVIPDSKTILLVGSPTPFAAVELGIILSPEFAPRISVALRTKLSSYYISVSRTIQALSFDLSGGTAEFSNRNFTCL